MHIQEVSFGIQSYISSIYLQLQQTALLFYQLLPSHFFGNIIDCPMICLNLIRETNVWKSCVGIERGLWAQAAVSCEGDVVPLLQSNNNNPQFSFRDTIKS